MLGTILFVTPILAVIFFAMSLWQYVRVKNANKKAPGTYADEEIKARKVNLTLSVVILAVLFAVAVGLVYIAALAIAYM